MKQTLSVPVDAILSMSLEDIGVALVHQQEQTPDHPYSLSEGEIPGILYWVESFGTVLLPATEDKREAEHVYLHSQSKEKAILCQVLNHRSVLITNSQGGHYSEHHQHAVEAR